MPKAKEGKCLRWVFIRENRWLCGRASFMRLIFNASYMFVDENQFETEAETVQVSIFLQTNVKGF